ncbi:HAD family hydrolase [Arthrobacter sp. ISL-48]|uniref:HAD family hydrolase n=1 Tax=Arthrobacter sp. ISL-48 TaxID=2819110 RepID=UPI001BEC1EB9|nr:HAD family hydrolase [Arthrobacter sp. ISL-48]MBT2531503.1 HAD family hydrolase [Arthrobacter sp. ISL-48]
MPLLLLDLDNTLVDRASAFRRWAGEFAARHGTGAETEVDWLVAADADGYEPRARLSARIRHRFTLGASARSELEDALRWGMADHLEPDPTIVQALASARKDGWLPFVITNGTVEQQERKLRVSGLDREVAGWVISESAGTKKPEAGIFFAAASAAGSTLEGAWMIGDSPGADIQGAHSLGIMSVWLHRGRTWDDASFSPTLTAGSVAAAIQVIPMLPRPLGR